MLKIYCGDRNIIRQKIDNKYNYTNNIISSLQPQRKLFGNNSKYWWFDYNNELKTKDDIEYFIKLCDKYDVICVLGDIDKRSIFYKTFTKQIQYFNTTKQEFTIKDILKIDDKDFITYLYKWYYNNNHKQEIAKTINAILTGKLNVTNAKQYLYLLTI